MRALATGTSPLGLIIPFAEVINRPHQVLAKATLYPSIAALVASAGGQDLALLSGSVSNSDGSAVRGTCSLELAWDHAPKTLKDPVTPFGAAIQLAYGITVPMANGGHAPVYWDMGAYRISSVQTPETAGGAGSVSVQAHEFSRAISKNKLVQPWIVSAGTNYGTAINNFLSSRLPSMQFASHAVTTTTPTLVVDPEADPWAIASDWAVSLGQELVFSDRGELVIRPVPALTASANPTWTYTAGQDALVVSVNRTWSDEPGYNGVVLTSESTTLPTPLRAEVWDSDPSSPTYAAGPYGRVPKFVTSPFVANQTQANAAAQAEFNKSVGGSESLSFTAVPNPVHQVGDVIKFIRPEQGIEQLAIIESITLPLGAGLMSITCRARTFR